MRQARHLIAALFVAGFIVAILDTTIPVFIGRVVTMVSAHAPGSLLQDNWPQLVEDLFPLDISQLFFFFDFDLAGRVERVAVFDDEALRQKELSPLSQLRALFG